MCVEIVADQNQYCSYVSITQQLNNSTYRSKSMARPHTIAVYTSFLFEKSLSTFFHTKAFVRFTKTDSEIVC